MKLYNDPILIKLDLTEFSAKSGVGPNLMNSVSAIASDMINVLISPPEDNFNIPISVAAS